MKNAEFNPHYDMSNPKNLAEIHKMDRFAQAMINRDFEYIRKAEKEALNGADGYAKGVEITKDWGTNKVIDFSGDPEQGNAVCTKELMVKPNCMLSLQRHMGRAEKWEVTSGTLTAIVDSKVYEVHHDGGVYDITGRYDGSNRQDVKINNDSHIDLPKGSVHCIINRHDENVEILETQWGETYEADNFRLADQLRDQDKPRETVPLGTQNEYDSAMLYWAIEREITSKPGLNFKVSYEPTPTLH